MTFLVNLWISLGWQTSEEKSGGSWSSLWLLHSVFQEWRRMFLPWMTLLSSSLVIFTLRNWRNMLKLLASSKNIILVALLLWVLVSILIASTINQQNLKNKLCKINTLKMPQRKPYIIISRNVFNIRNFVIAQVFPTLACWFNLSIIDKKFNKVIIFFSVNLHS